MRSCSREQLERLQVLLQALRFAAVAAAAVAVASVGQLVETRPGALVVGPEFRGALTAALTGTGATAAAGAADFDS